MYFYRRRNRLCDAELGEDDIARTPRQRRPTTEVPASQRRPCGMNEAVDAAPGVVIGEDQSASAVSPKFVRSLKVDGALAKYHPSDLELQRQAGDARVVLVKARATQPWVKQNKIEQRPPGAPQRAGNVRNVTAAGVQKPLALSNLEKNPAKGKPLLARVPTSMGAARLAPAVNAAPQPKPPVIPVGKSMAERMADARNEIAAKQELRKQEASQGRTKAAAATQQPLHQHEKATWATARRAPAVEQLVSPSPEKSWKENFSYKPQSSHFAGKSTQMPILQAAVPKKPQDDKWRVQPIPKTQPEGRDRAPRTAIPADIKVKSPTIVTGTATTALDKQRTAAFASEEAARKKAALAKPAQPQKVQANAPVVQKVLPKPVARDTGRKSPCGTRMTSTAPLHGDRVATAAAAMADFLSVSVPDYWIQGADPGSSSVVSRGGVRSASYVPSRSGAGIYDSSYDSSESDNYDPMWMLRTENLPQPPLDDSSNDRRMRAMLLATASLVAVVAIVFVVVAILSRLLQPV